MTTTLSSQQVIQLLTEFAVTSLRLPESEIVPSASLREDLGFDSIDMFDLVAFLDKRTGMSWELNDFASVATVADLVDRLVTLSESKAR
jgi:acyl carrier protein